MFEAKLSASSALIFKKTFEIVKDIVSDTNIACEEDGVHVQAMDSSHVALICVHLKDEFFKAYRCDRSVALGLSIPSFFKLLKAAKDDDRVSLSVEDEEGDGLKVVYEGKKSSRVSSYIINLLTIDGDDLRIPPQNYTAKVVMSSVEFAGIVKDLMAVHENVVVDLSKTGFRLQASGLQAKGEVWVKSDVPVKAVSGEGEVDDDDDDEDGDGHKTLVEEDDQEPPKIKKRRLRELTNTHTQSRSSPGPSNSPNFKEKRRMKINRSNSENAAEIVDTPNARTIIQVTSPVKGLTFKLKYLQVISKFAALSETVELLFSPDIPVLVRYSLGKCKGYIHYYLAPQIGDDDA
ncbi:proliferating cell nuclear antigen [Marasmius fiardii PR-910]|nr:proliferating cell nuclear antigen [Marasmius fiardii PR-910]